ncbi:hypothetical protein OPW33_12690 [Vibrio europaeus]|uniref:hypothetical protein n=1 Tax=Vibrio europaeus TaxID=300876 RepID=UPI00234000F6|nr:hypothetical protein [Vibrio europaeus]MDC5840179.1 hypothetical protein [Vibrio europaeus]
MSANSKTALNLINERIEAVEKQKASDNANPQFSESDKRLNNQFYNGALLNLSKVKRQIEDTLTWRDK